MPASFLKTEVQVPWVKSLFSGSCVIVFHLNVNLELPLCIWSICYAPLKSCCIQPLTMSQKVIIRVSCIKTSLHSTTLLLEGRTWGVPNLSISGTRWSGAYLDSSLFILASSLSPSKKDKAIISNDKVAWSTQTFASCKALTGHVKDKKDNMELWSTLANPVLDAPFLHFILFVQMQIHQQQGTCSGSCLILS